MKTLDDCLNDDGLTMEDIRCEVERIDRQIIATFGNRFVDLQTVLQSIQTAVKPSEVFEAIVQERRVWAEDEGLNPDVIEQLYRDLVCYHLGKEFQHEKLTH